MNDELKIDPIVRIRRQWDDTSRIGEVRFGQMRKIHWGIYSGGTYIRTPQPFIFAYVDCTDVVGEIGHSCRHGPPPHSIKVCVVQKDNTTEVFKKLLDEAGPKPPRR